MQQIISIRISKTSVNDFAQLEILNSFQISPLWIDQIRIIFIRFELKEMTNNGIHYL